MGCTHSKATAVVSTGANAAITDARIAAAYNPASLSYGAEEAVTGSNLYPILPVATPDTNTTAAIAGRSGMTTTTAVGATYAGQSDNSIPSNSRISSDPQVVMFRNTRAYTNGLEIVTSSSPFGSLNGYMIMQYIRVKHRPFFMSAIVDGLRVEYRIDLKDNSRFIIYTDDPLARIKVGSANYSSFNEFGITRSDLFENMTIKTDHMSYVFDEDTISIFTYYFLYATQTTQLHLMGAYAKYLRFEMCQIDDGYKILTIHA